MQKVVAKRPMRKRGRPAKLVYVTGPGKSERLLMKFEIILNVLLDYIHRKIETFKTSRLFKKTYDLDKPE